MILRVFRARPGCMLAARLQLSSTWVFVSPIYGRRSHTCRVSPNIHTQRKENADTTPHATRILLVHIGKARLLLSRSQAQIIFLLLLYERLKAERNFMGLFIRAAPCVVQIFLIATDTAAEFAYCKLFLGC